MRIDVKKMLFVGMENERKTFFSQAQDLGIIDFIDLHANKNKEVPIAIHHLSAAIKILRSLPLATQKKMEEYALADSLVSEVLQCKQIGEKLAEEQRTTRLEIARVHIFGDFSQEDIAFIAQYGKRKVQFFFAKHGVIAKDSLPCEVIEVGSDHGLDYFVAINPQATQYEHFVEMRIEHSLGALQERLDHVNQLLHESEERLKNYVPYNEFFHHALISKLNAHHLHSAQNYVQLTMGDTLFAVEGWVPVNKIDLLHERLKERNVYFEEIAVEATDRVPTCLQNEGVRKIGEDLVHIYDTPSPSDTDPSLWVLLCFSLFFAFIIGDAGYGLIFLGINLYMRYKLFNPSILGRRLLNLGTILCTVCIVWGILTNAFFGISFAPDSPMRKLSALQWLVEKKAAYHMQEKDDVYDEWVEKYPQLAGVQNPKEFVSKAVTIAHDAPTYEMVDKFSDNVMMELALVIGMLHIGASLIRYLMRRWTGIGWLAFIVGCYLYFPHYLQATSMLHFVFGMGKEFPAQVGLYLIAGGVSVAVLLSMLENKWQGILEVMTAVQVFSDVLSYLRLYALALAGAIVSSVINEMAAGMPFILGAFLLVMGHGVNIVLSIMSGVIHGLRLNFLEWYHYSFDGGGKMFAPLHTIKIE